MEDIICVYCNGSSTSMAPLMKCTQCGKQHTDDYVSFHRSLIFLDILLFRVGAYRHVLRNRFKQVFTNHELV